MLLSLISLYWRGTQKKSSTKKWKSNNNMISAVKSKHRLRRVRFPGPAEIKKMSTTFSCVNKKHKCLNKLRSFLLVRFIFANKILTLFCSPFGFCSCLVFMNVNKNLIVFCVAFSFIFSFRCLAHRHFLIASTFALLPIFPFLRHSHCLILIRTNCGKYISWYNRSKGNAAPTNDGKTN